MKKWLLATFLAVGALTTQAYDYNYLTVEKADGTTTSMAVDQLTLTFSDGQLVATNGDGTQTFTLADLSKMYFATDDISGISKTVAEADRQVEVFNVNGVRKGTFQNINEAKTILGTGLYIVKTGNKTIKIAVK